MRIHSIFRVGAGSKGGSSLMPGGESPGGFTVNHIGGDSEYRLGWNGIPIEFNFFNLCHYRVHDGGRDVIDAVIVVSVAGEVPFGVVVHHQAGFVTYRGDLGVFDSR